MEKINQFDFYEIGKSFSSLRKSGDIRPHEVVFELMNAITDVKTLLSGKPIPLGVSRKLAESLLSSLSEIQAQYFNRTDEAGKKSFRFPDASDPAIPEWQWGIVVSALERFETIFREELGETATYYVPRKGIYATAALVEEADESFPREIAAVIPEKTKTDWRAAGRCLALNLLTASGFHVARAVEGTLEMYYQVFSQKPDATLKGWGDYIDAIEKIAKANSKVYPSQKTIAELRQMKDDYRNPIAHPRVMLSEADARMLFNNGESLIICMAQDLIAAQSEVHQIPLPLASPDQNAASISGA